MSTPFLFFEFDASLFQKYYGSGINTPGIYAIPEDETEPSAPSPEEMEQMYNEMPNSAAGGEENDEDSALVQRKENQENISNAITSQPDIPLPQMSADEQQAYEQEIQPIKKVFILNGSPRENGNTHKMCGSFANGIRESGAEAEIINLYDVDFKGCRRINID